MKVYKGIRNDSGATVTVTRENVISKLDPRFDLRNHSPTGFEWGYGGSGPAQLSLAILSDHFGDDDQAQKHYQDFKFKVIGNIKENDWALSTEQINLALHDLIQSEARNG